jgi:hypothetical protein
MLLHSNSTTKNVFDIYQLFIISFVAYYTLDLNFKIASRINEEIRAALDTKELESFARQIASGMVNFVHKFIYNFTLF